MPRWRFSMRNSSHDPHDWAFVPERQMPSIQGDGLCPGEGTGLGAQSSPSGMTPPMALRASASTTTKDPPRVPPHPCSGGFGWGGALTQAQLCWTQTGILVSLAQQTGAAPGLAFAPRAEKQQAPRGHTAEGEAHPLSHSSDLTRSHFIPRQLF